MAPRASTSGGPPTTRVGAPVQQGPNKKLLRYRGHHHLRQRLVLAVLSGKSVRIDGIRQDEVEVGLRDYEVSFLRLLEKITNGTTIEISYTGTTLLLHPGLLPGGTFEHKCPLSRSVGYFLEGIIPLAMFGKKPLEIKLEGITGEEGRDMSADMIRTVTLPHLHLFGVTDGLELSIKKRGAAPLGGGLVLFRSPVVRNVKTLNFVDPGKIRRIRGIAYSTRVSPQFANRMVDAARSVLNRYIPDIYLYTDVYKGEESGKSPGYGLTLLSLSTNSAIHSAETLSVPPSSSAQSRNGTSAVISDGSSTGPVFSTPEDLALHASRSLLEEIAKGGCVDQSHQWLVLLLMVLGREDVARCRMGALTAHSIQYLRDLNDYFGIQFKITAIKAGDKLKNGSHPTGAQPDGEEVEEDEDEEEEEEQERTIMGVAVKTNDGNGKRRKTVPEEFLVSCLGIGYGNINRSAA